jgi:hypothetical protein
LLEIGLNEDLQVVLVNSALTAANDNEKCRGNGVRALGNIVPICTPRFLEIESEALIKDIVHIVCKNIDSGAVKVNKQEGTLKPRLKNIYSLPFQDSLECLLCFTDHASSKRIPIW